MGVSALQGSREMAGARGNGRARGTTGQGPAAEGPDTQKGGLDQMRSQDGVGSRWLPRGEGLQPGGSLEAGRGGDLLQAGYTRTPQAQVQPA